ncbi:hypothetical protein GWK47_027079 [Chionoecetes opilio]|uniref:Uncharacterized protein n=1 Tax=Chionoecetes opilio TaxID=41210 RepID=A0A8J8WMR2_CHIOP|nr:hypothetical protein GWK47_027079 [Chionoecetes opilio]
MRMTQTGDDADEDDDTETRPVFTIMKLRNLLRETDNLTELFTDQDPIQERSIKFKRVWVKPYTLQGNFKEHGGLACQKPITAFFKPSPASTPAKSILHLLHLLLLHQPDSLLLLLHQIISSSMSSVSPIPLCGFDDPDDTDSEYLHPAHQPCLLLHQPSSLYLYFFYS